MNPNYVPPTTTTAACGAPGYKGDGNCDDENNKASCDYDGGDCCGLTVSKKYCKKVWSSVRGHRALSKLLQHPQATKWEDACQLVSNRYD